jgi:hypothetical protein
VDEREKPKPKPKPKPKLKATALAFSFGCGFSLSSTLLVEERAGRGGLLNIAFDFCFSCMLSLVPNSYLTFFSDYIP